MYVNVTEERKRSEKNREWTQAVGCSVGGESPKGKEVKVGV